MDWLSVDDTASELHKARDYVDAAMHRKDDPLPFRMPDGARRGGAIIHRDEFNAWIYRNSKLVNENAIEQRSETLGEEPTATKTNA